MRLDEFDKQYFDKNVDIIAGVDEAGRGPLAGAVYAAAVILPDDFYMPEINDSKKLSEKKRERLFDIIRENAVSYAIAKIDAQTIDEVNILNATFMAMKKAVSALGVTPHLALIDGNRVGRLNVPAKCIVGGDAKSQSIAAASILAKVARDRYCIEQLDRLYPEYCFIKHKGYGTKLHIEMLKKYGPCNEHRKTFLKKILNDMRTERYEDYRNRQAR